jgi:hypothetical protein
VHKEKPMKRLPVVLIVLGVIILIIGFVYDVLFAGIPYPDPTPALAAAYDFHSRIASIIRWSGMGVCILAGLVMLLRWRMRKGRNHSD